MRILWQECKKIVNPRLLLVVVLFTVFFYNLFLSAMRYPNDSASSVAELEFCQRLRKEAGNTLPLSELDLVYRIREEQTDKLDRLIAENEVFQKEGIETFEQMRELNHDWFEKNGKEEVRKEIDQIVFETGEKEYFLVQTIDSWLDQLETANRAGLTDEEAEKYVREFYSSNEYLKYTEAFYERMGELYTRKELSIVPESMMFLVGHEIPLLGILMMISCVLLLLPCQIREKLSKVRGLQTSTRCGRKIWNLQLAATLVVSLLVCVVQLGVYFTVLWKTGILDFAACPITSASVYNFWFDMSWGTYLGLYSMLITFYVMAVMAIFYLISRMASNYVIGVAFALVPSVLFGKLCTGGFKNFLCLLENQKTIWIPVGVAAGVILIALILNIAVTRWDRRRDIFE